MSIKDMFESEEHRNNLAHFASIVSIALSDGEINKQETSVLSKLSNKLDVTEEEYDHIMRHPEKYSIQHVHGSEARLERLYDLFKIIYADHYIDDQEKKLILKYAIGLGCTGEKAKDIIEKSIRIFEGGLDFENYKFLLER